MSAADAAAVPANEPVAAANAAAESQNKKKKKELEGYFVHGFVLSIVKGTLIVVAGVAVPC